MGNKIKDNSHEQKYFLFFRAVFWASFFLVGLYYEACSAIISVFLFIWLILRSKSTGLVFRWNAASIVAFVIFGLYTISPLWAVDKGLSTWAIAKYLPIPLFVICIMQLSPEDKLVLYRDIPLMGVIMAVLSFALQYVPTIGELFSVKGQLAGFFEYPNAFACFLMLGIIVTIFNLKNETNKYKSPIILAVLSAALFLSGSRAALIIGLFAVLASLIISKGARLKVALPVFAVAVVVGYFITTLLGDESAEHIQNAMDGSSSFLSRIIYWKDALPVILRNPMGMGYLGYYFTQGSFQTGVYSVRFIHNDLLQLMLDIGWLPAILAIVAVIKTEASKKVAASSKVLLLSLLAHCCFEFHLAFISFYFLIFLFLDTDSGKEIKFKPNVIFYPVNAVLCCFALYIGVVSTLSYFGVAESAVALFPYDTFSNVSLLMETDDIQTLEALSDNILKMNSSVSIAWDAKANVAYTDGDFEKVITYKTAAISLAKYSLEEYLDYFEKLKVGRELYIAAGDKTSADICKDEILGIKDKIDVVLASTSEIAWKVKHLPELELPDSYYDYIATF